MTTATSILPGCTVLPPMGSPLGTQRRHQFAGDTADKAGGKNARRKTGDRFALLNAFVDFAVRELTRAEALVWLVLYRDTKAGIARTAQSDIARRAGINVRTVKRAIAGLERCGLLEVVCRGSIRAGPSSYRVRPFAPHKER